MTVLDRILLGICAAVLIVLSGLLLATIWGNSFLMNWLGSGSLALDGGIVAAIFILLAVYLAIFITRSEARKFIVYPRELGVVKISVDSVESLIVEAAEEISGVEQVRARITDVDEPKVSLRVSVYPDHNLPALSEDLQETVKAYVEQTVGVVIQEVEVLVLEISKRIEADRDEVV